MEILTAYFIGVCSSLTVVLLLKYRLVFRFLPGTTVKGYLVELEKKIREMPFIYKDLEVDIINDFVDVEFQIIDLNTLKLRPSIKAINIKEDERLRRTSRVLFLGNAGIGKTTFQRRTILDLINNRKNAKYLYQGEQPIPVYVPLKAIDNSSPFPIFRYVTESNTVFSNWLGMRKLLSLAKQRRLFLFIDGYDEIPFTGGDRNFVQEELGQIFSSKPKQDLDSTNVSRFYQAVPLCRAWLTSRREFFERNQIARLGTSAVGVAAVELRGIGNNRIKLAKKIFDKYRLRSREFYNFLDEEFFLYEIDNSRDDELKGLSYNPLFLTVMCYIYAQKALEEKTHKVHWTNRFEDLILECVDLLLHDLDQIKARDLPEAHRAALLLRRNPYFNEKKAFLQYFALQLFFDNKSVFSLEYLKSKLIQFFRQEFPSSADEVAQSFSDENPSRPDIALQLIYQGVFVLVDRSPTQTTYDFPHRRFREVLASKYSATPDRYEQLLANIDEKQFSEFLQVFFVSSGFQSHKFQDDSLSFILEKAKWKPDTPYFKDVTFHFMQRKPKDYDPSPIVLRFLLDCLDSSTHFRVSRLVLTNLRAPQEMINRIPGMFRDAQAKNDPSKLSLCCAILEVFNSALLIELLRVTLTAHIENRLLLPVLFQYAFRVDYGIVLAVLEKIHNSMDAFLDLCYSVSWSLSTRDALTPDDLHFLDLILIEHQEDRKLVFFYFINVNSPQFYELLQKRFRFAIDSELYDYAMTANNIDEPDSKEPIENSRCYLITKSALKKVSAAINKRTIAVILETETKAWDSTKQGRSEKLYAPVSPSKWFKSIVLENLEGIRNRLYGTSAFEKEIQQIIKDAIAAMLGEKPYFVPEAKLPPEVRAAEVRNSKRFTPEGFANEMTGLIRKHSLVSGRDVDRVRKCVESVSYQPIKLLHLFD